MLKATIGRVDESLSLRTILIYPSEVLGYMSHVEKDSERRPEK